jgi:hypothetical protein
VATLLLTLALLYDVFFVFISPLIFHRSVMVEVATGGDSGSTGADVITDVDIDVTDEPRVDELPSQGGTFVAAFVDA